MHVLLFQTSTYIIIKVYDGKTARKGYSNMPKKNIVLHMSLNCVRQQKPLIDIMTPRMAVSFVFTNNKIKSTTNRKFEINILFVSI